MTAGSISMNRMPFTAVMSAAALAACALAACSGEKTTTEVATHEPAPSLADCDVTLAEQTLVQCKVCHSLEKGAEDLTGPNLFGVVGRKAGSKPGFAYSPSMRESGIVWSTETLDAFLANPQEYVPDTRMAFGGVADPAARAALVCFLRTLR